MAGKIPRSFTLMNRTWAVRFMTDEEAEIADKAYGYCDPENAEILLNPKQNREHLIHTYYHELVHALFFALGKNKLNRDEDLVDAIGGAFHHYESTKEGSLTRGRK
jgi:Zn-dependent peptidase ImmA (M78 family)